MTKLIEKLVSDINDKRRWRRHNSRVRRLPPDHRPAVKSLERYLMYSGAFTQGGTLMSMLEDLDDLFEQSAANGTQVREIVGDDPVAFADAFIANYREGQWIDKERQRLTDAIDRAAGDA